MSQGFNPNSAARSDAGIFGLPNTGKDAQIILIPVPWEATVSYGAGTSRGPQAIFDASGQIDLYHHDFPDLWQRGIWMEPVPTDIALLSDRTKHTAAKVIAGIEQGLDPASDPHLSALCSEVDSACESMHAWVEKKTAHWISQGRHVGLIGGDHSTPLGYFATQAAQHEAFGLLVIDAHMDLRQAYEGFTYSHASVFYNAMERFPQITRLVQAGIRDYCLEEKDYTMQHRDRIQIRYDRDLRRQLFRGGSWDSLCNEMIASLPEKVHISFDIDGLDPKLCPHTGTPVPGGLQYEECIHLLNTLKASGRTIIGFDLCEVSPGEDDWDGNVGARMLFHLCGMF